MVHFQVFLTDISGCGLVSLLAVQLFSSHPQIATFMRPTHLFVRETTGLFCFVAPWMIVCLPAGEYMRQQALEVRRFRP